MWKVHDLSRLTGVSVRTLHHYDAIELLTPSSRQANGYRLYAERDLTRLQQIVALKFLGFSLKQITELLAKRGDLKEQLALQSAMLGQKIESLRTMQRAVDDIVEKAQTSQTLDLHHTLKLIEVYRMNTKTGKAWLTEVMEHHQASQKIMSERVTSGLQDQRVLDKIAESAKGLEGFIKKATPFIDTDPTTLEASNLADEWFALVMEVFAEQVEIITVLSQRYMLDKVPTLPCKKEFAEWMILARTYHHVRHSWIAKTLSKEQMMQYLDMVTLVPVNKMLARQKAQTMLLQEVKKHLSDDPASDIGKDIAQRWGALNDEIYNKYPDVKKAMQKAYWDGKMPNAPYAREEAEWLRDASLAAGNE